MSSSSVRATCGSYPNDHHTGGALWARRDSGCRGVRGRPDELYVDQAYDSDPHRDMLRRKGIAPCIARRGEDHGSGLGLFRWVVERTIAWYHGTKRLRIRWERRGDMHEAFCVRNSKEDDWRHALYDNPARRSRESG